MLESSGATPIGPGRVKLVQVLDGDGPPPVPAGQAWGEVGVCEICLHVRGVQVYIYIYFFFFCVCGTHTCGHPGWLHTHSSR